MTKSALQEAQVGPSGKAPHVETEQRLNLSHPLQARKWLRLIEENAATGIRVRPALRLERDYFGFSFTSNALGLRGPANLGADSVIMGTSFAMGLGVDAGENWYEREPGFSSWLNLGLPVGIHEWGQLLAELHRGARRRLVVLYHPNVWNMSWQYRRWRASGRPVFAHFRWKTGWPACAWLALRRALAQRRQIARGELLRFRHGVFDYEVPTRFTFFNWRGKEAFVQESLAELRRLAADFEETWIVRVPVKQQFVPAAQRNGRLAGTLANYAELWQQTTAALAGAATCLELPGFDLADFLPRDVHWNARGNRRAAQLLGELVGGKTGTARALPHAA